MQLDLAVPSLRYHLGVLVRQGLAEEVASRGPGTRGRPPVLYRAARHALVPGFPPRHFEMIAAAAVEALVEGLGEDAAVARLRRKGASIGQSMIEAQAKREGVGQWTPDAFERFILDGLYRAYGTRSEVLSKSPNHIEYRAFTCPFLEMAEQMPEFVCDSLDLGFHEGVDAALGKVTTERVACMGHGNPYCEYRMTWRSTGRKKRDVRGVPP